MINVIVNIVKWCIIINALFYFYSHFCLLLGLLCVDYKNFEIDRKRKLDWKTQNLRAYFKVPELNKRLNRSTTYVIELTVSSFSWLTITIFMNFDPRISNIRRITIEEMGFLCSLNSYPHAWTTMYTRKHIKPRMDPIRFLTI